MIKFQFLYLINILRYGAKQKQYNKSVANGFTLAEVLITLLIIGVIASIVIPNLINETNDAELHAAWKKNYAEVSAAFNRAKMENGGTLLGACNNSDNNCLRNLVMPYLSYTKSCNNSNTDGTNQCIYSTQNSTLKIYCGRKYTGSWYASALQLNNGATVLFFNSHSICGPPSGTSNVTAWCGSFFIDVNGYKGPNTAGKDFYLGLITPNGALPGGALDQNNTAETQYNASSCDKSNPNATGWGCGTKFLSQ